jgi:hypothetical protein
MVGWMVFHLGLQMDQHLDYQMGLKMGQHLGCQMGLQMDQHLERQMGWQRGWHLAKNLDWLLEILWVDLLERQWAMLSGTLLVLE